MQKQYWTGILLLGMLITGFQVKAQLGDKMVPHLGFMYEVVDLRDPLREDISRVFYTFSLGTYYTLGHKNDVVSVGIDPSVNFGFNLVSNFSGSETGLNLVVQAPVFLMGRLGANATKYNQQKFGVGAGIGGVYTFFREGIVKQRSSAFNPAAMAEITFMSGGGPLTIRGHVSLFNPNATLTFPSGSVDYNEFRNFGFGLIYGL